MAGRRSADGRLLGYDAPVLSQSAPLERQFGEIPGLSQMTSSGAVEYAQITLQFDRSRTVDSAAQDVQAAINAAAANLPPTLLNPPIFRKTNPADTPILLLALTSDTLPLTKVSDYANSILAQKIAQMPGVGLVTVGGQQNPAIRVRVNPAQLAAEGLDLEAARNALSTATVNQAKGTLCGGQQASTLQTNADDGARIRQLHPCLSLRPLPRRRADTRPRCRPRHCRGTRQDACRLAEHA